MAETRLIKKYANRRMYDSATRQHLTLDDVRELIVSGERVRIVEGKEEEDITRQVLVQIIAEQEQGGRPLLSNDVLEQLIRFYGNSMHDFLRTYLDNSVASFMQQTETMQAQMSKLLADSPIETLTELTKRNMEMWRSMQEHFCGGAGRARRRDEPPED